MSEEMLNLSAALPHDMLIELLQDSINDYKNAKKGSAQKDAFDKVCMASLLVASKRIVPSIDDVKDVAQRMKEHEKMMDLMNPNKSQSN